MVVGELIVSAGAKTSLSALFKAAGRAVSRLWSPATIRGVDISGTYTGSMEMLDEQGTIVRQGQVSWAFTCRSNRVGCRSTLFLSSEEEPAQSHSFELKGTRVSTQFVQLGYDHSDLGRIDFGSEILRFDGKGDSFEGRFVGYSPGREAITMGRLRGRRTR